MEDRGSCLRGSPDVLKKDLECIFSHQGQFQAAMVMSLNTEFARDTNVWLSKVKASPTYTHTVESGLPFTLILACILKLLCLWGVERCISFLFLLFFSGY